MNKRRILLGFAALFCALSTLVCVQKAQGEQEAKNLLTPYTRHVFLLVVQNLGMSDLSRTPNIEGLAQSGVQFKMVDTVMPNTLDTVAATLVSGLAPAASVSPGAGNTQKGVTLPGLMEQRGFATALVGGGDGLGGLWKASYSYPGPFKSDAQAIDAEISLLNNKHPFFSMVVLSGTGQDAVAADTAVGSFIQYLQQYGLFDQSIIAITGTGKNPPLILKGWQLKEGAALPAAGMVDVAPTLAGLTGFSLPYSDGLMLWDAMKTGPGESEAYFLNLRVHDLSIALGKNREKIYSLVDDDRRLKEEMLSMEAQRQGYKDDIKERDGEINRLYLILGLIRFAGMVALVAVGISYIVLYKVLKKKFLFFT